MKRLPFVLFFTYVLLSCQKPETPNPISIEGIYTGSQLYYNNNQTFFSIAYSGSIDKVEYFFEGQSIGSSVVAPFKISWTPKDIGGGNHIVTAVASSGNTQAKLDKPVFFQLRLGDVFRGGTIFYLQANSLNGLIAAPTDLTFSSRKDFFWGPKTAVGTNADGQANTKKMALAAGNDSDYAGYHFRNGYALNDYSDWYIPTFDELSLLKTNKQYISNVPTLSKDAFYYSSSEVSANEALGLNLLALTGENYGKNDYSLHIRPIRKF